MSWEDFVAAMTEEDADDTAVLDEEAMEQLFELHCNPIDINSAQKEDLEVLPFLSEQQVKDVLQYVERYGPMVSLGELMMVGSLWRQEREMLRLFVKVDEKSLQRFNSRHMNLGQMLKYSHNEAVLRTDVPFYTKDGYKEVPPEVLEASPNKVYRGDKYHHSFRYAFSASNHLLAGLQMEKDAGERGVDYVSAYAMVKDLGMVKRAVVGNYRLSFGQGLAVNSAMKFGKMTGRGATDRMDIGITKHSSTAETGYFTGAAATLQLGHSWQVSAFGSYRKADATPLNDGSGMSALKTDGLHRTQLERNKKGNITITDVGGNLHWEHDNLRLSTTVVATHLSVPLLPKHDTPSTLYRLWNAHGQDFFVASVAYSYRLSSLTFSGETAYSDNHGQHGIATLGTLRWRMNDNHVLTLVARKYGAKFVSLNGKAFGENANVQNEEGLLLNWNTQAIRNVTVEAYVDVMHFPWMKYQVSNSSYGYEGMVQATLSPSSRWSLLGRYRIKAKQRDFTTKNDRMLVYKTSQNVKLQLNYAASQAISLRTSLTGVFTHFANNPDEKGFAIGENIRWQSIHNKCRIDFGITYFTTDSYDSRIYSYEPSLLYSFGFTSYAYHGLRTTLFASVPIVKQSLFINAKLGLTRYFNRDTIGSGLDLIRQNHREDLQLQLRWKF